VRYRIQTLCRPDLSRFFGVLVVLGCVGLCGCKAPRREVPPPRDDKQAIAATEGRFEVQEERYENGSIKRRTEGRVGPDGKFIPHGLQTIYAEDGRKLSELTYVNGVRDGLKTSYYPNGQVYAQGRYVAGREDGPWTVWSAEGRKLQEFDMDHGAYHGMFREWHLNGQLKYEVEYVKGLKQGTETFWDEQGNVSRKTEYVDGKPQP